MAPLLEVEGLTVWLPVGGEKALILHDVSFSVSAGESLGIVGESGSGKTVLALAVMGILPQSMRWSARRIRCLGRDLDASSPAEWRRNRGRNIAMIFQEPMTALNPVMRVGDQIKQVLYWRRGMRGRAAQQRATDLLKQVEIPSPSQRLDSYPHELSGGMRQRVMIAMALAGEPKLLIADEPTTALDVTIQAQILALLRDLQHRMSLSLILITHDLGVIAELAHRVMVLYAGEQMETATVTDIFDEPAHPYTQALIASAPNTKSRRRRLQAIPGSIPQPGADLPGCLFAPRCPHRAPQCEAGSIPRLPIGPGREVTCLRPLARSAGSALMEARK
jgi:oligopeptide/dipeptide ABC transporter ATP-binding protein